MKIEDKAYFAVSSAETEKKIRDLTATWRKLMNVADNLHGMANPSPEIMKRQDQVDADMERIGDQIAELKKSIGVQENVSVRLSKPVEDKAYFEKEWTDSGFSASFFIKKLQGMMAVYQGEYDNEYKNKIIGYAILLANHPDFVLNGVSSQALAKKAFALVKFKYARQGSKAKMGFLSGTKKQQIDYVFGVGTNYGERAWKSGIKRLIDDKEALARIRLLKYELDPLSPMRNTVDKEFDKGWLRGYTSQQIQESENPPKFKKGDRVLYNTGTAKHIGTIEKVSPYAKPEAEYIVAFTTLSTGRSQLNIPESSISKSNASRTGTKSKFANRGAFAEASSSPVLGSLLEKKVMPEGGWRAVETDGAALVIAFEDNDIAGNFARRAAENGYSATAPMAMAGRFWNVKVQNENKQ